MRIAYLGPAGTYSEEAAIAYGGADVSTIPAASSDEALKLVEADKADLAVIPIENSTAGTVTRTLDLLANTSLYVCGEVLLPIHHQLLSKTTDLKAITSVMAHPQALAQCRQWLDAHLPKAERLAAVSNAQAAAEAAKRPELAAIAGKRAAGLYGLSVVVEDIEDIAGNTTRFVAVGAQTAAPTGNDKTSLVCSVPNKAGALYELLGILAKHNVNMSKLESRPTPDAAWEYIFFIDVDGYATEEPVAAALAEIKRMATFLRVIGSYPKA